LIVGGSGFIGSHFAGELLRREEGLVRIVDNLCSGSLGHIKDFMGNPNFELHQANAKDTSELTNLMTDIDTVIHLASNPDIAKASSMPRIDFVQGTVLTESVVEASRISGVSTILYASGSGVYGDAGHQTLFEDSPLNPISTYGASKLAGESLLSSYSFMFGMKCLAFRFANVVGPRQTHGVGYDFLRRLREKPHHLAILGDGSQTKSYIHVSDVVNAVLFANEVVAGGYDVFNIATPDQITVNEIAVMAEKAMGINPDSVTHSYSGGDRGWKADVPVVKLSAQKIKKLGWTPSHNSQEAMSMSLSEMAKFL
jgi:UDP-glucose 4-epimerase